MEEILNQEETPATDGDAAPDAPAEGGDTGGDAAPDAPAEGGDTDGDATPDAPAEGGDADGDAPTDTAPDGGGYIPPPKAAVFLLWESKRRPSHQ